MIGFILAGFFVGAGLAAVWLFFRWLHDSAPLCHCDQPDCGGGCAPRTGTEFDDWFAE